MPSGDHARSCSSANGAAGGVVSNAAAPNPFACAAYTAGVPLRVETNASRPVRDTVAPYSSPLLPAMRVETAAGSLSTRI